MAAAAAANIALYFLNPFLALVALAVAPIAAASWICLSRAAAPLLVKPGRIYYMEPGGHCTPGVAALAKYSVLPSLFSFSAATLIGDALGYPVATEEAFVDIIAATIILLPLIFVAALNYTLDTLEIGYVEASSTGRLSLPGWLDELVGAGAALSLALYIEGLAQASGDVAAGLGYAMAYLLFTATPALTALVIYAYLGSPLVARKLVAEARPLLARPLIKLACHACGRPIVGGAEKCPYCGSRLRPAP